MDIQNTIDLVERDFGVKLTPYHLKKRTDQHEAGFYFYLGGEMIAGPLDEKGAERFLEGFWQAALAASDGMILPGARKKRRWTR